MTKTTFGKVKVGQQFSTISEHRTEVYPNGVKQDFTKQTRDTGTLDMANWQVYGFTKTDVVWVKP
jgi:hypothetical protein